MAVVKNTFAIKNMQCAMCASHVREAISGTKGVKEVNVNLASSSALIEYDDAVTSPQKIREAVVAAGYDMSTSAPDVVDKEQKKNSKSFLKRVFGR